MGQSRRPPVPRSSSICSRTSATRELRGVVDALRAVTSRLTRYLEVLVPPPSASSQHKRCGRACFIRAVRWHLRASPARRSAWETLAHAQATEGSFASSLSRTREWTPRPSTKLSDHRPAYSADSVGRPLAGRVDLAISARREPHARSRHASSTAFRRTIIADLGALTADQQGPAGRCPVSASGASRCPALASCSC